MNPSLTDILYEIPNVTGNAAFCLALFVVLTVMFAWAFAQDQWGIPGPF